METPQERLNVLVHRFKELQDTLGLSDNRFAGRYKLYLGSAKSWSMLKSGDIAGYRNPSKLLVQLEKMASTVDGGSSIEKFIETPFARQMSARLDLLRESKTDRRILACLAQTGCGKSAWARHEEGESPDTMSYVRVLPTWRESLFGIARGMATSIGAPIRTSPRQQIEAITEFLKGQPRLVINFDEAHDGGVLLMKLIKMWVDCTSVKFIYMAFPTEWDRVRSSGIGAVAEARQFCRRVMRPIFDEYRDGVGAGDVSAYLKASLDSTTDLKTVSEDMLPLIRKHENLSILEDAIIEARNESEATDAALTPALVHQALRALCKAEIHRN